MILDGCGSWCFGSCPGTRIVVFWFAFDALRGVKNGADRGVLVRVWMMFRFFSDLFFGCRGVFCKKIEPSWNFFWKKVSPGALPV